MTDWIAVLLAEQRTEEEREAETPVVKTGGLSARWAAGGPEKDREPEPGAEEAGGLPEPEPAGTAEPEGWLSMAAERLAADGFPADSPRTAETGEPPKEKGPEAMEPDGTEKLSGRGDRAEESVRVLWRRLVRGEAALAWSGPERSGSAVDEPGQSGTDIGRFDRMVERDARRYDGGFELY